MGIRFRRIFRFGPFRLNIGKSGPTSVSVGRPGLHYTVGRKGRRITVGLPGTGVSYTTTQKDGKPEER